jgi:hypothetical protein
MVLGIRFVFTRLAPTTQVDLPWSVAVMQKFRICAGAVKVSSAKLLMGISW